MVSAMWGYSSTGRPMCYAWPMLMRGLEYKAEALNAQNQFLAAQAFQHAVKLKDDRVVVGD